MPVTLRDIAKEVNVSHTTVSLVLNNRAQKSIPQVTRDRVLEAAARLGYRPNHMARALVTGRSNAVAIWTFAPHRPFYAAIVKAIQGEADKHGYRTLISQTPSDIFEDSKRVSEPDDWPVDGIIAVDSPERVNEFKQAAGKSALPIVGIGSLVARDFDHVVLDVSPGIADAVRYLWRTGRRKIAYVTLTVLNSTAYVGTKAYEETIREVGGEDIRVLLEHHGKATTREAICDYISKHGSPDAFLCRSDEFAIGTFRALRDMNLRVPEDVAIIGCGGIDDLRYFDPEISTITAPIKEMCDTAWTFLENRFTNPSLPIQRAEVVGKLEVRGSALARTS